MSADNQTETILVVDDEAGILSALQRTLRRTGYQVITAGSGAEGLECLGRHAVDLIISDMRMPEMNGAEFLARAAQQQPSVVRVLLTGYADMDSTVAAINEGKIAHYIEKPWDDNDLRNRIDAALKVRRLERERDGLLQLTQTQNEELKRLNENLEARVKERTAELRQTMGMLDKAHETLKQGYLATVKVFSGLIEMRAGTLAGHARRVAELAHRLAMEAGMDKESAQQVLFAGLLHEIGKIGLPDELLQKPLKALAPGQRNQVARYPVLSEAALMALEPLRDAARYIRSHREAYNGAGYPDRLAGDDIPLGARVLAIAADFDGYQCGMFTTQRVSAEDALQSIRRGAGVRFDPKLVEVLTRILGRDQPTPKETAKETSLCSFDLKPGMVLARDIRTGSNVVLLARGHVLDEKMIARLRRFEMSMAEQMKICVYSPSDPG